MRQRKGNCDYGNSAQGGLRRLDKAAESGNDKAALLLKRVIDPSDKLSIHAACVQMGWRKPKLVLGLDPKVMNKLETEAAQSGMSTTSLIEEILEAYYDGTLPKLAFE